MDKQEFLAKLEMCIYILETTDNLYVRKHLQNISDALVKDWNESNSYAQEIRQVLNYDETMYNLNNIWTK
jgi:hypothetical protein